MLKDYKNHNPDLIKSLQDLKKELEKTLSNFRLIYPKAKMRISIIDCQDTYGTNFEYVEITANEKDDFTIGHEFSSY